MFLVVTGCRASGKELKFHEWAVRKKIKEAWECPKTLVKACLSKADEWV